jgi:hypothetical protein
MFLQAGLVCQGAYSQGPRRDDVNRFHCPPKCVLPNLTTFGER